MPASVRLKSASSLACHSAGPSLALRALSFAIGCTRSLQQAHEAYDRTLLGSALVIAERLAVIDGEIAVAALPHAALEMLRTDAQDRIFYRVADTGSGTEITGYDDLPAPAAAPPADEPLFYDARYKSKAVRVVALTRLLPTGAGPRRVLVQVAETLDARRQLTRRIVTDVALVQLLLIGLAAALITLGVQRGLAPLARRRKEVRQRPANDLRPISVDEAPAEVPPLIDALNVHTGRQRALSDAQAQFVANASHQLKTPLTVLRAQIGHALMQTEVEAMRSVIGELNATTEESLELYQLPALLEQLMTDPRRIIDIRWHLNLGQVVSSYDARRDRMERGRVVDMRDATVVLQGTEVRAEWKLRYAAIEPPTRAAGLPRQRRRPPRQPHGSPRETTSAEATR